MEVLTVVVLLGIFALIAVPRFANVKKLSYTTARELVGNLRNTRSLAINTGVGHYLKLLPSGGPYTEYKIFDKNNNQVGDTQPIPDGVTCTATTDTFLFNYFGSCNNGNNSSITLVSEGETYVVEVIGITGRAYIQ